MNVNDGKGVDGRGSTDSHSDCKLCLRKACSIDESESVSCIKRDHASTVPLKRSTIPVEEKFAQRVSSITRKQTARRLT